MILFAAFGIRLSFTVFFVALIDDFGWSRADTSLIFSTTMIVFAATSTAAGVMLDRWGARTTFTIGAAVLGCGLLLSSQIQTLGQLAITYGVIAGLGITILGLSMHASVIRDWFKQRLGAAIGLAFAGTGLGAFIVTPSAEALISRYDWRTAIVFLAILILLMIIPVQLFSVRRPADIGLKIDAESPHQPKTREQDDRWDFQTTIRTPAFWLMILAGIGAISPVRMMTVHQFAIMADSGIGRSVGAQAIGFAGVMAAITFIFAGMLSDRIGRVPTYVLGGIALIGALTITNYFGLGWTVWPYAILLGIGEGTRSSLVSATTADIFAGKTLGAINGTVGASYGVGAAILPWAAGWLFDQTGSYATAIWIGIGTICVSMIALGSGQASARNIQQENTPKHD
ncbi:MAG: MFS transporter [Chloroflexota bacterium]